MVRVGSGNCRKIRHMVAHSFFVFLFMLLGVTTQLRG